MGRGQREFMGRGQSQIYKNANSKKKSGNMVTISCFIFTYLSLYAWIFSSFSSSFLFYCWNLSSCTYQMRLYLKNKANEAKHTPGDYKHRSTLRSLAKSGALPKMFLIFFWCLRVLQASHLKPYMGAFRGVYFPFFHPPGGGGGVENVEENSI